MRLPCTTSSSPTLRSLPAMRSPEMSYSPAYYQDQGPLGTTRPHSSIVTPPPAARRSQEQSVLGHPVGGPRSSTPVSNPDAGPRTSGSRAHRVYRNQALEGSPWPELEPREIDSIPAGSTSSGVHKEERVRSSWADRPSLMSGGHSNPSITRVRKRTVPDHELLTNDGQDAPLMLVCEIHRIAKNTFISKSNKRLAVSPHNCPLLLLRCCSIFHIRHLFRPSRLTSPPLFILSIPSLNTLFIAALRSSFTRSSHPRTTRFLAATVNRRAIIFNPVDPLRARLRTLRDIRTERVLLHPRLNRHPPPLPNSQHCDSSLCMDSCVLLGLHHDPGQPGWH